MYNPYLFDKYPNRKNPRLKGFDYTSANYYFVTICTHEKRCIFGMGNDLSQYGRIAEQAFSLIPSHFPGICLDKWVVMPNHVHAIIVLPGNSIDLPTVVGSFKSYVTKRAHEIDPDLTVWQTSFHDHIIRDQQSYEKIFAYIEYNPLKWSEDCYNIP